jgi:hypothetical protein
MKIKVSYDSQSGLVKGYYPNNINYNVIPEPFIEINEDAQDKTGKQMVVENGEYKEYKSLEQKIILKLQQLDNYHFNSSEIREMKINDYFILSLSGNGRALIAEQIQSLEQQIKLNVITEESAIFEYFYNGGSIEITLVQLRQLYIFMLNVVNTNYGVYKAHIHAIKNLSTIEEVEAYDFTVNYLKNQNLDLV